MAQPGDGMEALYPFSHILPYLSLPSVCSSVSSIISFYNKLLSVSLSFVSHCIKLSNPRRGWWELDL